MRDVGALNLALAVVLVGAALRADRATVRLAATTGLAAAVPHTAYHALHLAHFPLVDAALQTAGMVVHLALLTAVLVLSFATGGRQVSGRSWCTASTLLPSGSRRNTP